MSKSIARSIGAFAVTTLCLSHSLAAQTVEYSASANRYRLTSDTKGTQTAMGNVTNFDVHLRQVVSVNATRPAKDTLRAAFTLDSMTLQSPGATPDLSKLLGATFVANLTPTGKFISSQMPAGIDPVYGQVTESLVHFLPTFRANLTNGTTWGDTTRGPVMQQGVSLERTAISNFRVNGDTTIGGQKAWRIHREATVKAGGAGAMQGTPVTMEQSGMSTGDFFLTPKGVYLGGGSTDNLEIKITIPAQSLDVVIKQNGVTKVEAIK